ncbi:MAG: excinuclease ABC subunit A [Pseudomonadota bacterium]
MSHETATTWLKAASWALIIVGVYFALALYAPLNAATLLFLDLAVMPFDGTQSLALTETRLLTAIVGGLTVGLGAGTLLIAKHIYASDPALGGKLLSWMFLTWFVVDCAGSVLAGAWFNVALNTVILASVMTPLMLRRTAAIAA